MAVGTGNCPIMKIKMLTYHLLSIFKLRIVLNQTKTGILSKVLNQICLSMFVNMFVNKISVM